MVLSQSWISLVVRLTSLKWFQRARHTAVSPRPNLKLHRGTLTSKELPVSMRAPVYSLYSKIFGANISEASEKDVRSYPSLASFFRRRLRPGARPIHKLADMVRVGIHVVCLYVQNNGAGESQRCWRVILASVSVSCSHQ
jgi:hypothetical protein